jgi:hypothetical protein
VQFGAQHGHPVSVGPAFSQRGGRLSVGSRDRFGGILRQPAQFYRRGYLRWIDATKRSPEMRQHRIATMVELLEAGIKDYRNQ